MRVSPVGWAFDTEDEVLRQARRSAEITHDHPEGIKDAQATALAVYLARTGAAKTTIRARIQRQFGYDLAGTVETLRPGYAFDVSCQGTVPPALIAFLDAESYEDTVRNAVSLGGDSDTLACIAGSIAEAFYGGVPDPIRAEVRARLTPDLWAVVEAFEHRYPVGAVRC
jgi:ADP-ribosylglycohydrolase